MNTVIKVSYVKPVKENQMNNLDCNFGLKRHVVGTVILHKSKRMKHDNF